MIKTKEDLYYYLSEDKKEYGDDIESWRKRFGHSEQWYLWKFVKKLRYLEYYKNTQTNIFRKLLYNYKNVQMHKLMFKMHIYILPNIVGPGLYIPHIGKIHISGYSKIGKNFTVRPGTLIVSNLGVNNKKPKNIEIGDNVELSEGCKILCKKIGNNVIIAPNSVVTRNVPDNTTVYGNPCEFIPRDI